MTENEYSVQRTTKAVSQAFRSFRSPMHRTNPSDSFAFVRFVREATKCTETPY
jgi:hypothetical protein